LHQLQTTAWWDVLMPSPHILHHSHVFIFSLNIKSLSLHKNDVCVDYNLKASHILCLNETTFQSTNIKYYFFHWSRKNFKHNCICTKLHNDNIWQITTLSSHETFTILGIKFITTTFNTNTIKVIHVIAIYKPSTLLFSTFINQLQKLLDVIQHIIQL
jgi:hypothetical protein